MHIAASVFVEFVCVCVCARDFGDCVRRFVCGSGTNGWLACVLLACVLAACLRLRSRDVHIGDGGGYRLYTAKYQHKKYMVLCVRARVRVRVCVRQLRVRCSREQ